MKIRDKTHKKLASCKNKELKLFLWAKYRKYRNLITELLRKSKANHYQCFFTENAKHAKKFWRGINEIINNKKQSKHSNCNINVSHPNGSLYTNEETADIFNN